MILLAVFVAVSSQTLVADRIGTLTTIRCAEPESTEDCVALEKLNIQPQVDWSRLERADAKSKKRVEEAGVDQYGGLWYFSLPAKVRPKFAGYSVDGEKVEVLDVAPPKKKRRGFKLFGGDKAR